MNLGREGIAFVMIVNDFVRMLLCFRDSSQEVQLLRETTAGLEGQLSSAHSDLLNAKGDIERCVQVSGLRVPPSLSLCRQERDHLSALETLTRKCASCEEELGRLP